MKKYFFVGICGVSMSALAVMLSSRGNQVRGYDEKCSEILQSQGIIVKNHFDFDDVLWADEVVYSSAFNHDHELLNYARQAKKVVKVRGEALGEFSRSFEKTIAIAGSHGKSTVSAMIYQILKVAGKNPSLHLGAYLKESGSNFDIAGEEFFVTEACEYHDNFLFLKPYLSLITNIEKEHLDYFKSFSREKKSFQKFANQSEICISQTNFKIKHLKTDIRSNLRFDVFENDKLFLSLHLQVGGNYNAQNALFAIAAAQKLGIDKCIIKLGLESFKGLEKRFEHISSACPAKVFLDYAHHPQEIESVFSSAKNMPGKKIVVFQPHTYSRTKAFMDQFAKALSKFDEVVLFKTYAAREKINIRVEVELIKKLSEHKKVIMFYDLDALIDRLKIIAPKDSLFILGAGDLPELLFDAKFIWRE